MSRALWVVMDSLGLGAAPDAAAYGDAGADTFVAGSAIFGQLNYQAVIDAMRARLAA